MLLRVSFLLQVRIIFEHQRKHLYDIMGGFGFFWNKSLKCWYYFIDSQTNLDWEEPLGLFSPTACWKQVPSAQVAQYCFNWVLKTLSSQISNVSKKGDINIFLYGQFCCCLIPLTMNFLLCPTEISLDATSEHFLVVLWHVSAWFCLYN